ncbi:antibiotic biosynthesis monooxygenase family protein [Saccharothrix syringae]|uniref:Antibiotic biosynthesis monooxygenase n=1 Tax=Saccharothrix syringae TaxID=103733 RepID=A0A5Q0H680_SACSY|nr:antibiotic biosynthesis monooxygenase family protein [Saccharothrix syringae]QFZ21444.1 antibiotic biosynthesis monooxygenase [Saccharothrix syringae]
MAYISPEDGYLTVFNLFDTDSATKQDRLVDAMRDIVDNAAYPGWVSSTVHAGVDRFGTANYVQWRSLEELEARYAGQSFRSETIPEFRALSTSVNLVRTEVVACQAHPDLVLPVEIGPHRDDHVVIIVFGVDPGHQAELVDVLATPDEWVKSVPGYRAHTILRGIDGTTVVNYAQWDSKETYDAFHTMPEEQRPADVQALRRRGRGLVKSRWANAFRPVHTRSAAGAVSR